MAVISKILTSTLVAGTTYVSFTDSDIPNSLIRVFADDPDLMYQTVSLTGNTLTLTYEAQTSNKSIALDIVKQGLEVIDTLDSTDVSKALSANQGRILKTYIDNLPTPVYELSDLDDVEITEISDGQVLAWDDDLQKFVNVEQSGGGGEIITVSKSMTSSTYGYFTGFTDIDNNPLSPDDYVLFDISIDATSQYYHGMTFITNDAYYARMFTLSGSIGWISNSVTYTVRYSYMKK